MVKAVISCLTVLVIILGAGILENRYVYTSFDRMETEVEAVMAAVDAEAENAPEGISQAKSNWAEIRKRVASFIPHTDLKDIELYFMRAETYLEEDDKKECLVELSTLLQKLRALPDYYLPHMYNIF